MREVTEEVYKERTSGIGTVIKIEDLNKEKIVLESIVLVRNPAQQRGSMFDFGSVIRYEPEKDELKRIAEAVTGCFRKLKAGHLDTLSFEHVPGLTLASFLEHFVEIPDDSDLTKSLFFIWDDEDVVKLEKRVIEYLSGRVEIHHPSTELKLHVWYPEHHGQRAVAVLASSDESAQAAADAFVANAPRDDQYHFEDWKYPQHYTKKVFAQGEVATFDND